MINALYSQVFGDTIEKRIAREEEVNVTSTIKGNILKLIKASISSQEENTDSICEKIVISSAKKAQMLVKHIKREGIFIQEIIANNQTIDESLLFVGKEHFYISDIYDDKKGCSLFSNRLEDEINYIKQDNTFVIVLESGNTEFVNKYCNNDGDMDCTPAYGILMHMSSEKMKKNLRHLTWKVERTKGFDFWVFGELIKCSEKYYKVCPYAIWC